MADEKADDTISVVVGIETNLSEDELKTLFQTVHQRLAVRDGKLVKVGEPEKKTFQQWNSPKAVELMKGGGGKRPGG